MRISCTTILAAAAWACLPGCGADLYQTATVTGTVTCNGKPAVGGVIRFRPVDAPEQTGRPPGNPGRNAYATVQEDGTFTLMMDTPAHARQQAGALIGQHQVFFELPRTQPVPIDSDYIASENPTPEQLEALRKELDEKYPVYQPISCGTGITPSEVEVKPGQNHFEFILSPQ